MLCYGSLITDLGNSVISRWAQGTQAMGRLKGIELAGGRARSKAERRREGRCLVVDDRESGVEGWWLNCIGFGGEWERC